MLTNIPNGINKRICDISSSKEVFLEAIQSYQVELKKCGYKDKLVWMEECDSQQKKKRSRSKKVIWFNPPYGINVKTNVGEFFFELIDKHFPKGNPIHKI
jgi:23S rRNA G2445 N2-methylase RlmL